jgi:GTP-binding protein HflX
VIDAASPEREGHVAAVRAVLDEIGAGDVERLDLYNKCDLLDPSELRRLRQADPAALYVSARTGDGRGELLETITSRLALDVRRVTLEFDAHATDTPERVARVYRHARVLRHVTLDGRVSIDADVPRRALPRLQEAPPP